MTQLQFPQTVVAEAEFNGIEMGVLNDGTPYLTLRGLARVCNVAPSTISEQFKDWVAKKRTSKLARSLIAAGFVGERLSIELPKFHAVPDGICVLVLDYYAFDGADKVALGNYRILARQGLKKFIYDQTGYDPASALPRGWRDFHDRLELSRIPAGRFGVFRELSEFLLRAIQAGLVIDSKTVPDISVGLLWSKHWIDNGLDATFGERVKCEHDYPSYYPQSATNPQEIWGYPIKALGEFRAWLDEQYIPTKFATYLSGQVKKNALTRSTADLLLAAVSPAALDESTT